MKITVLNGSPKGNLSVTMQYVHFIRLKFPAHQFVIHNISDHIRKIERDDMAFQEIISAVSSSDGVIWAFPLHYFLVPGPYKRFIELIWERKAEAAFRDKFATVITTSIHIMDHAALNYMHAICDDLAMHYTGFFSPSMYDLKKPKERERLLLYADNFFRAMEKRQPTSRAYAPVVQQAWTYVPGLVSTKVDTGNRKVLILTDAEMGQTNLAGMTDHLRDTFSGNVEVINLHDIDIKGGCTECLQCGYDNTCLYTGKDGYIDFFNTKVKAADVLVFAGKIRDRYLSSLWKVFFDRSFFNTHMPTIPGKQVGFIISGPLRQIPNLRQILETYTAAMQANCVDLITDEDGNSTAIDALLEDFAERLMRFSATGYIKTRTSLEVGMAKIVRDELWSAMRFPFRSDHRYFKAHGLYDFPQKKYKARIRCAFMSVLTMIPPIRKEIYTKAMKPKTVEPLEKIVARYGGQGG
jgi:multimeric flavodoxin WrbA